MEQNNKRRVTDAERLPAGKLEWYERPTKWTLLMTADNHGLVGEFGSKWEGHPAHYERINVQSLAAPAVDAAKLDDLGKLKALAEAAEKGGQHVYTHPRDSNKFADNDRWHIAATPEAFLRIAALVAQLEAENDRLRGALGDEVAAATMLTEMSISNGGFNAAYEGGAAQMLAEQFAEQFRLSGATNYLEIGCASKKDGLRLLVTLQRCDGKTPATFRAEAEALVAQQAARIADLERELRNADAIITKLQSDIKEDKCGECGGRAVSKGYEQNLIRCTECGFTAAPAVPAVDALTDERSMMDAAWDAYQNAPFDHAEDSDAETRKCVEAAVRAALAAPADPEQAKLDILAQAGLAAALENRAKGGQSNCAGSVAVEAFLAEDGVDGEHPSYGRGVFFTLNCMKEVYVSQPQAAPEATSEQTGQESHEERLATIRNSGDKQLIQGVLSGSISIHAASKAGEQMGGAQVAKAAQPIIGKLMDDFSALPVLWGLNEPGALVRCSDVFKMLVAAGKAGSSESAAAPADEPDHGETVLRVQEALGITTTGWVSPDVILLRLAKLATDRAAEGEATERKPLTDAARDVLAERQRQVEQEGWTPDHDDKYKHGQMRYAAAAYVLDDHKYNGRKIWPWPLDWWEPRNERRNLVKAGALILAEIERMDRIEQHHGIGGGKND